MRKFGLYTVPLLALVGAGVASASVRPSASSGRPRPRRALPVDAAADTGGSAARRALAPILVADDDLAVLELIERTLTRVGYDTVAVGRGDHALEHAQEQRPALVLLDIGMPGANGYVVCRELKLLYGMDLPVIFISGEQTSELDRVAGILIGANDYLLKPFAPDELLARVERLLEPALRIESRGERTAALTARECEVLALLVAGRATGEMAAALYISRHTLNTHIKRILAKLGVHSRAQAVVIAAREGLIQPPPE